MIPGASRAGPRYRLTLPFSALGEIAQLVEHTTENRGVPGSSPGLAISRSAGRLGDPLRPDDDVPGLDAGDHEPFRVCPGIVGELVPDPVAVFGVDDQQHAQA